MKLIVKMDSTLLSSSNCILNFVRTGIGDVSNPTIGAYKETPNAAIIYGVAVHKFIDTMFKTGGHYPSAKDEAIKMFHLPKSPPSEKRQYLNDIKHMLTVCYLTWEHISNDGTFERLSLNQDCYWCKGSGRLLSKVQFADGTVGLAVDNTNCSHCNGTGKVLGPATELTFSIKFYEDDNIIVFLEGTIDDCGKFTGGGYAIGDWKTTGAYRVDDYLSTYELSRQLRMYVFACKLMSIMHPDSILGKVGATNMGAFINAIFLKPKPNEIEFVRSDVFRYSEVEMADFKMLLIDWCEKLSRHIRLNYFPREGILNGTCEAKWGKCKFWNVCKVNNHVSNVLLNRDFKRVNYEPLKFNTGE